ncbi:hypothetical protein SAMN04490356_8154 [Streptomyces melanosporofaciens]|uniref:Uncharacterized protein n=1 Tax=Streptomyces melanosporofaciens TaxID=67327 RepID=A0A1H5A2Z5_STRMJ|nr:hypothetical protein [Streptomyces melanosporofaciens]SED36773.1 hypothetical protein SAMN04490356_8154 [Streptomyces melanosporofaciens]
MRTPGDRSVSGRVTRSAPSAARATGLSGVAVTAMACAPPSRASSADRTTSGVRPEAETVSVSSVRGGRPSDVGWSYSTKRSAFTGRQSTPASEAKAIRTAHAAWYESPSPTMLTVSTAAHRAGSRVRTCSSKGPVRARRSAARAST